MKKNSEDLADQKFGRLKVIRISDKKYKDGTRLWECKCDCGNISYCLGRNLKNGVTKSCGCLAKELSSIRNLDDLTNKRFGRLTVVKRTEDYVRKNGQKEPVWECKCDCGNKTAVIAYALKSGQVKSCGCLKKEITDLKGEKFGHLTVISFSSKKGKHTFWECKCDCGKSIIVNASSLVQGCTVSCGHIRRIRSQENILQNQEGVYVDNTSIYAALSRKIARNNTSGYTGVMKYKQKWRAYITFRKKRYYLGDYIDIQDAVKARKKAEGWLHGDFLEWYAAEYPEKWEKIKRKVE